MSATARKPMFPARDVFVIMPFSGTKSRTEDQWTVIFEELFRPAVEECGLSCSRATISTGSLIKSIIERLHSAYVVLADLTDANPNVFYELGVRHSLSKRTVLVAQGAQHIPSDLRGYWSLSYGTELGQVSQFKSDLKRIITKIEQEPDRSDSPVSDYLDREFVTLSRQVQRENIRRLGALYTELTGNAIAINEFQADSSAPVLLSYGCVSLLLETLYLDPGPRVLQQAYELRNYLRLIEDGRRDVTLLALSRRTIDTLTKEVQAIREKLISGEFSEPESITTMEWVSDIVTHTLSSTLSIYRNLRQN
jgi:hypothetical protein